ncbi:beta-propeller domain-containing protein [Micromonospora sp. NPDC048999]|uniref:beta-propeller domain-containing protein n=1 Tax=Micromonospora sp. NPDC048999 TaxID=3155391 RepID=UPI0033F8BCFD
MRPVTTVAGAAGLLALALLGGSSVAPAMSAPNAPVPNAPVPPPPAALRLISYDSCAEALAGLRAAATAVVGPWGFGQGWRRAVDFGAVPAGGAAVTGREDAAAPAYSGTNNHESGADEPDLVKTDGRRIVTVTRGVLRVVDPATRRESGRLDLAGAGRDRWWPDGELLLHGDRALVLVRSPVLRGGHVPAGPGEDTRPRLLLVDLVGPPRIIGTYRIEGGLLDARLTGSTARVVVRSEPLLSFRYDERATDAERTAANRAVIAKAGLDAWLPRYEWTADGVRHVGRVGCDRLSRPASSTGTALLTVLTFDLATGRLGDGDPVSIASDADLVYGTSGSLYLAGEAGPGPRRWDRPWRPEAVWTEIYQFDTGGPGHPRYVATGSVPGTPVNQYALSEWQGHLRVATTRETTRGTTSESAVHVLTRQDDRLAETGVVTGLGRGERIYSVRFLGGTGYVVTFRQTDPLYALDLTDPAAPRVTGELKISGWSSYLHPVSEGRLLGVGQEADGRGRALGLQVSLFDVHDPARPARLARYHLPESMSTVEYDPHAFLFDPTTGLLALPLDSGAIRLLTVNGGSITEVGTVNHGNDPALRSLLVGGELWIVSEAGLRVTDPATARTLGWLPLT